MICTPNRLREVPLRVARTRFMSSKHLHVLFLVVVFFLTALFVTHRSLAYPWFYDDYHLVRPFSHAEIRHALTGNWDVDGVETPGYRPLTPIFNDIRARIFGENVVEQRLFILVVFSLFLAIYGLIGRRLGMTSVQVVLAGIFTLSAKDNWFNLIWITDGNRVFAGLLTAGAGYLCLSAVRQPRAWKSILVPTLAAGGLFIREEPLAAFPVIIASGLLYLVTGEGFRQRQWWPEQRSAYTSLFVMTSGIAVVTIVWYALRKHFVPGAVISLNIKGWLLQAIWTLYPMGRLSARGMFDVSRDRSPAVDLLTVLDPTSGLSGSSPIYLIWAIIFVSSLTGLVVLRPASRRVALFWLASAFLACSPGLVTVRANLLFFPICYFGFYLGTVFGEVLNRELLVRTVSIAAVVFILGVSARNSMLAQENEHPQSVVRYYTDQEFIWGDLQHTTVPASRREEIRERFRLLGIYSNADDQRIMPALIADAKAQGRFAPDGTGKPFLPRITFIEP